MTVKFKYYRAEGEKVDKVINNINKEYNKTEAERESFINELGAETLIGCVSGWEVYGVMFNYQPDRLELGHCTVANGDGVNKCYIYYGDNNTKEGIELRNKLQSLSHLDFRIYACSEFGIPSKSLKFERPHTPSDCMDMGMWQPSVIIIDDCKLFFKIPYDDETPLPAMPSELIEITEAEFKGLTQ